MNGRVFLDTNLLAYAYDVSEPSKQQRAIEVLDAVASAGAGVVSTQVLAEFFLTVTRKLSQPLSVKDALSRVSHYLRICYVLDVTGVVVLQAIDGVLKHRLHYWDAQIWAVARLNQIPVVFSEDFSEGTVLEGVRFVNPLRPAFRVAEWL